MLEWNEFLWDSCERFHHFWPVSMGSLLRKGTLHLDAVEHTDLHKALNQHLSGIGKYVEGKWVTMWARKGNPTKAVTRNFSPDERLKALTDFYTNYQNKKYLPNFKSEISNTMELGKFK